MGIGGISIWQLLIIALIIVLLFGTKKLRTLGTDLGGALKGFKKAMKDDDDEAGGKPTAQLGNEQSEEATKSSDTVTSAERSEQTDNK